MEVKSAVLTIEELNKYFFVVPDYQREYVWKSDDHVSQFLEDVDNESNSKKSYFIGSVIVVKNQDQKYDVVDGQQRLTTIVLTLCALRKILEEYGENDEQMKEILKSINNLLYTYNMKNREYNIRLELQYEESKDYLTKLIKKESYDDDLTPSIKRMQDAYNAILDFYRNKLEGSGLDDTLENIYYFLTKVEIVFIESEDLGSALKIFETINQRGAGLNAMDLIKNLLFRNAKEPEFTAIKEIWKNIPKNLQDCGEDNNPMRFLRYFFLARYYDGKDTLREDDIYKWLISESGKKATNYELKPLSFAKELSIFSKRYSDIVKATECRKDETYKNVARIGNMNKYKSRQHLILLLALHQKCGVDVIEYLAKQIESYFFYCVTMHVQAKHHEQYFSRWAKKLRNVLTIEEVKDVVEETIVPYLKDRLSEFQNLFRTLYHTQYNPLYRQRYVLGCLEERMAMQCNLPVVTNPDNYEIEHILPQSPKDGNYVGYADETDYQTCVYKLGNVTLLESTMNQALNKCNDLSVNWFAMKQGEYGKSAITMTKLLDANFQIGTNTAINRFKTAANYKFTQWDRTSIEQRQAILLDLALDTWTFNGKRLDK